MEMTPIDPRDNAVSSGDGATPHGRELSSSGPNMEENRSLHLDPKDIVKREVPVDQTAKTIAAMLRRADPHLDAQTAANMAKHLLEHVPPPATKSADGDETSIGTTLDVSA
jgi:hypothetical protein